MSFISFFFSFYEESARSKGGAKMLYPPHISTTNLLPCDRGFTSVRLGTDSQSVGNVLLVRWERTLSPLGTYWSCDPMKMKKKLSYDA